MVSLRFISTLVPFLIFSICFSQVIQSQSNHQFTYGISSKDGLVNEYISDVIQGPNGFIWMATNYGLVRYDGENFLNYSHDENDSLSISSNYLHDLCWDEKGFLWIGTINGLNKFNPYIEEFSQYYFPDSMQVFEMSNIYQIINSRDDSLLWLASNNLLRFNKVSEEFEVFYCHSEDAQSYNNSTQNFNYLEFDKQDSSLIWLSGQKGMFSYSIDDSMFKKHFTIPNLKRFHQFDNNEFVIGSWEQGLVHFNSTTGKVRKIRNKGVINYPVQIDENKVLFADFELGILEYDNSEKKLRYLKGIRGKDYSLKQNEVRNMSKTGQLIWVNGNSGSNEDLSIQVLDPSLNNFQFHPLEPDTEYNPNSNFPSNIVFNDSTSEYLLVTSTGEGLYILDDNLLPEKKIEFHEENIFNLASDEEGNLIASTHNKVFSYSFQSHQLREIVNNNIEAIGSNINYITFANYGFQDKFWIGTFNGGLIEINPQNNDIIQHVEPFQKKGVNSRNIGVLCAENSGDSTMWVGTTHGLYAYDGNVFTRYDDSDHDVLIFDNISWMVSDNKGNLWMSNQENGIQLFDVNKRKIIKHLTVDDGLVYNKIFDIHVDNNNDLWMLHHLGLSRYDTKEESVTGYHFEDGLPHLRMDRKFMEVGDERLVLSGYNCLYTFHPDSLFVPPPPKVGITSVKIYGEALQLDTMISHVKEINLKHHQDFINIGFQALNYFKGHTEEYRWRMKGLTGEWNEIPPGESNLYLSNLKPGKYELQLNARCEGGKWNSKPTKLRINIVPAWWQTNWFKLAGGIIALSLIFIIHRFRSRQALKKEKLRKQMAELELQALRSQINPHFIFNSLSAIYQLIQSKQNTEASQYLNKFSKLIRKILQFSEQKSVSLKSELEISRLFLDMEKLRFEEKFDYDIEIDDKLDLESIFIPPLIIQPYLENAVWHGILHLEKKGKLTLGVTGSEERWRIVIDDNGIGREAAIEIRSKSALKDKSRGMNITLQRIKLNQLIGNDSASVNIVDKKDAQGDSTGTRVIMEFNH